jgi:putative oxidoreductase
MSVNTMTGDLMHADIRAAAGVNDAILAIGRILIAIIFVSSGVEKFMDLGATTSAIASKSLPYANVLAVLTAIVEAGGGLLIIFGWQTRLAALALAIFCAVAAYFFHDFWNQFDSFHEECEHDRRPADASGRRRPRTALASVRNI